MENLLMTLAANVSSRILIGLAVPATVTTLFTGYYRPSNAAIVSSETAPDALILMHESESKRRWLSIRPE